MRFFVLILSLWATSLAWAGEDNKPLVRADFAYGLELSLSGQGAIYGLAIPSQVYQSCTRADLGDLRVFNAQGVVPHFLRPQNSGKSSPEPVVLPFFPLLGKGQNNQLPPNLHIATDSKGTIIDIRQDQGAQLSTVVSSYIIDTSGLDRADWLEFAWSGQGDHFSTSVQIDGSDDLSGWRTLVRKASLAELRFAGHDLLRNRITIRPWQRKKYLRLSWPAGVKGVVLTAVKAGYNQEDIARPRTVHSYPGTLQPGTEPGKAVYHYSSDGFFPVDQLYVRLAQHNSLAQVSLSSRASEEAPWRQRATMLAYQLTIDGVSLESSLKHIRPTTDRFWRLEMEAVGGANGAPMLELGWLPQQLVFVAQGQGPYTLAYGRAGLGPERSQVDRLLTTIDPGQDKNLVRPASAGNQIILGGKGQLLPTPEIPWRRWLLWASLGVGVLVIGGMALQLLKEMQASGKPDSH